MTWLRLVLRLARREARRDARRLVLSGALVSVAVALGTLTFASANRGEASGANLSLRVPAAAGIGPRDDAARPPVRVWNRAAVHVRALGRDVEVPIDRRMGSLTQTPLRPADGVRVDVPAGTEVETYRTVQVRLVGRERRADADLTDPDLSGRLARADVVEGRAPRSRDEIALVESLAERLAVGVGDTVRRLEGERASAFRVVGLVSAGPWLGDFGTARGAAVVAPGSLAGTPDGGRVFLLRLSREANPFPAGTSGGGGGGRTSLGVSYSGPPHTPDSSPAALVYFTVFQALYLCLPLFLTAAVLAVGLERRARERALLALVGAGRGTLRALAALRGLAIAAIALGIGLVAAPALAAALDAAFDPTLASYLLPAAVTAVGCVLASMSSERTAERLARERRDAPAPPDARQVLRSLARGVALLGLGPVLVLVAQHTEGRVAGALVIGFGVTVVGGLAALAPALVALPAAVPLRPSLRAAARASGRARWVAAPAATAVALISALFTLTAAFATGTTTHSSGGSSPQLARLDPGDRRLVAVRPEARSDAAGRLVSPRDAAAEVLEPVGPQALAAVWPLQRGGATLLAQSFPVAGPDDGAIYAVDPAALARFGVPASAFASGSVVIVSGQEGTPALVDQARRRLPSVVVRRPWSAALPHHFVALRDLRGLEARRARLPIWLARADVPVAGDRAADLRRAAERAGLELVPADGAPFGFDGAPASDDGWSRRAQVIVSVVLLGLVLLFGGIACALVATERRDDTRRLVLAGAAPRDQRLAAAVGAGGLAASASLMAAAVIVDLWLVALWNGGGRDFLVAVAPGIVPLVVAPPLLALAAAVLTRPRRELGPIGRRRRDVLTAAS